MKFIDIKKIFSVSLAVSTLFFATVSADGSVNNADAATNAGNGWDKEKVKYVAKKSAPYVAGGVPLIALLVGVSVCAAKHHGKSKGKKSEQTDTNHSNQSSKQNAPSAQRPSAPRTSAPLSPCTPQEISDAMKNCELPGIKFWVMKGVGPGGNHCYFYTIENLDEARRYFAFLSNPVEEQTIIKWQNHSIFADDIIRIFGKDSKFKDEFKKLMLGGEMRKEFFDPSKDFEYGLAHTEYERGLYAELTKIEKSGKIVIKDGMQRYTVIKANRNLAACRYIDKELSVPATGAVAAPQGGGSTGGKPTTPVVSQTSKKTSEPTPTKDPEKDSETAAGGDRAGLLVQLMQSSAAAVGATAVEETNKNYEDYMNEQLAKGCLPGFKFYRYKPWTTTYHCYIITDYNAAKTSLGVTDECNDESWKKVVLYQNRWLDKKRRSSNSGWSFENLFGFNAGTFGGYFDKITKVDENMRQGSETLKELPTGCKNYKFGWRVFERGDPHLGTHSDRVLSIICPASGDITTMGVFEQQVNGFKFTD